MEAMTMTVEVPEPLAGRLAAEAARRGVSVERGRRRSASTGRSSYPKVLTASSIGNLSRIDYEARFNPAAAAA